MIKYTLAAAMLPASCAAPLGLTPDDPTPSKPPCAEAIVVLASADHPTLCDVSPPQLLAYWVDDPGPIQEQECYDAGGTLLYTRNERHICFDIDY